MNPKTNLQILRRNRKPPKEGDVFAMLLPANKYLFGRVIKADVPRECAPMPQANLIYIYRWQSVEPKPDYKQLIPDQLLLTPQWTNRMAWTKGLFLTVDWQPLSKVTLVPQHCFWSVSRQKYVDELGKPLPGRFEPCGEWSLCSYRWIDDHVSDAVGIPRVSEE